MADPEVKTDAPVKKKNPNRLVVDEAPRPLPDRPFPLVVTPSWIPPPLLN